MFGARNIMSGISGRSRRSALAGLGRRWGCTAPGSPWRVIIMIGAGTLVWDGSLPGEACRATGGAAEVRPRVAPPPRPRTAPRAPVAPRLPPARSCPSAPPSPRTVITQFVRTPHFQGRPSVFMAAATAALIPDLVYFSFFLFRNWLNLFSYVCTRPGLACFCSVRWWFDMSITKDASATFVYLSAAALYQLCNSLQRRGNIEFLFLYPWHDK